MTPEMRENNLQAALFEYCLRLGDDLLVLGHRLSEWCGHAPILEEDVALANIALDCIGQAEAFLHLAGALEGQGRSEDDLAYRRDEYEFRNLHLVEQPRGDFAFTMVRQFLFDAHAIHLLDFLRECAHGDLAAVAAKTHKETLYHLRHAREWVLRLGGGTDESHRRTQHALDAVWMFTGELFANDDVDRVLREAGIAPDPEVMRAKWRQMVAEVLDEACLRMPSDDIYMAHGSRQGKHSEHLGHLLSEMQILARSHPEARW